MFDRWTRAETLYTPKHVDELATGHFISNNNLRFPQEPRGCALIVRDVLGDHTGSARFRCLSRRNPLRYTAGKAR